MASHSSDSTEPNFKHHTFRAAILLLTLNSLYVGLLAWFAIFLLSRHSSTALTIAGEALLAVALSVPHSRMLIYCIRLSLVPYSKRPGSEAQRESSKEAENKLGLSPIVLRKHSRWLSARYALFVCLICAVILWELSMQFADIRPAIVILAPFAVGCLTMTQLQPLLSKSPRDWLCWNLSHQPGSDWESDRQF